MFAGEFEGSLGGKLERLLSSGSLTGLSEGQLLDRFASTRDQAAFEALLERHGPMVLGVCRQFLRDPNDVDDAFQATFLVLVRKAGSLRQQDLLGNWLYGVACRVAARARSLRHRSPLSSPRSGEFERLANPDPGGRQEPAAEAAFRSEERPLLHEEVSRLPQKYRSAIVLCYFEGLTHVEAAARLGWPIGTVKGRLSRARELLRSRLARRGVAVSASALAVQLAGPELRASVPASLTYPTIRAALAAVSEAGPVLAGSSAVSLSVTSLTEGVMNAMVLSQARSLVLAVLAVAGILTTGASVLAFQGAGGREARPNRPLQRVVPPDVAKAATTPPGPSAGGEAELARKIVSELEKLTSAGELNDPESFHTWSLRLLEAEKREAPPNTAPIAAFEAHQQRMKRMLQTAENLSAAGQGPRGTVSRWQFFLKESERLLEGARGGAPGGGSGMMDGMMGRGGMMAGSGGMMGRGGMMGASGGMMGGYAPAMMAGGASPAAPAPTGPQAPPFGGDSGGGFGGGGGDSDGPSDQESRIRIARISALLSTVDKSPKTLAVLKKLDDPVTLHFPTETPLDEVLKRIEGGSKGSDGRRIPIYVDPLGLQEADKALSAPVTIDLEDTPLKFSLRLILKQLGLAYCVRDGVLIISSVRGIEQEMAEALAEQRALNPDKFPAGMMGGGMGGMGGGMGGMGGGMGMM